MHDLSRFFDKTAMAYIQDQGFPELTKGQLDIIIATETLKPLSAQNLAEKMGLTKQAVSRMVKTCEQNGFINRVPSEHDSRSYAIELSTKGFKLMAVSIDAIRKVEQDLIRLMGQDDFNDLGAILARVFPKL